MNCILPLRRWRVQRCDTCRYIPKRTHSNSVCQGYNYQTRMHSSRMRTARTSNRVGVGGVCLSACWDTPRCGNGDLQGMLGYHPPPPPRPAARNAGIPSLPPPTPTPTPVNRITDTCKNITLPQLRCGR